jgi:transposase
VARAPKKARAEGSTIVWGDDAGFSLLPLAVRTWAPRGQTPVLRVKLTHDHLAAISGSTLDGRLYRPVQEEASDSGAVVGFLRVLLRTIPGTILIIWEGSPIHKGQPIKDLLQRGAAKRLHLERLPGYAPELNPDEGLWNDLKRVELKNRCCRNLEELSVELRRANERLRHKRAIIRSCSRQCGYLV